MSKLNIKFLNINFVAVFSVSLLFFEKLKKKHFYIPDFFCLPQKEIVLLPSIGNVSICVRQINKLPIDISEILSEECVISLSESLCAMLSEKKRKIDVSNLIFLRVCVFEAQILIELLNIKH